MEKAKYLVKPSAVVPVFGITPQPIRSDVELELYPAQVAKCIAQRATVLAVNADSTLSEIKSASITEVVKVVDADTGFIPPMKEEKKPEVVEPEPVVEQPKEEVHEEPKVEESVDAAEEAPAEEVAEETAADGTVETEEDASVEEEKEQVVAEQPKNNNQQHNNNYNKNNNSKKNRNNR